MSFLCSHAVPDDSAEIISFLNAIAGETDHTSMEANEGFWLTEEEERKVIREAEEQQTGVLFLARVSFLTFTKHKRATQTFPIFPSLYKNVVII